MTVNTCRLGVLPTEIWSHVFHLSAELPPLYQSPEASPSYRPFCRTFRLRSTNWEELERALQEIWHVKMTLPLVCRFWRDVSASVTYEEIHVGKHINMLLKAFERSELAHPGHGNGRQVRYIFLNYWSSDGLNVPLSDVLRWCPNVFYLAKNDSDIISPPIPTLDLTSIRRYDWAFMRGRFTTSRYSSRGRDFLRGIVARAPHLQYLRIAIAFPNDRISVLLPSSITAHSLTTLHVQHVGDLRAELELWSFPNLKHLITDSSLTLETLSTIFSPQLEVIEFLRDEALYNDALTVLQRCPNLRELNYYIEFASVTHPLLCHQNLDTIRLYAEPNHMLDEEEKRTTIEQHLTSIVNGFYPSLKRVIFYGDSRQWGESVSLIDGFPTICDNIRRLNCILEDHSFPGFLNT